MENLIGEAKELIVEFKGNDYAFGSGVLDGVGSMTAQIGQRALLVSRLSSAWLKPALDQVMASLKQNAVDVIGPVQGAAAPNAPREDGYRLQGHILHQKPDVIVSLESGSGIDACKATAVLEKILTAAKDPQLESKLQNMPVPLTADLVDQYMGPVLEAAWSGDLTQIAIRE